LSKIRLVELAGEGFLFVLEAPLEECYDSDVVVIPQNQIEELFDPYKTLGSELITGNLAMELKMHLLQEQIAFFEDRDNLKLSIRRSEEFPEESYSRDKIATDWEDSLKRLRLSLAELKESNEEKK
jgi:hypothetical protein